MAATALGAVPDTVVAEVEIRSPILAEVDCFPPQNDLDVVAGVATAAAANRVRGFSVGDTEHVSRERPWRLARRRREDREDVGRVW